MTALNEYDRLECAGVWRATEDDQRRDVTLSLGDATLVIYDSANRALAHWSLPALVRRNPGKDPAIYAPGKDAPEELEVEDDTMVDAIERIRAAIQKRRPRQGRLRFVLTGAVLAAVAGAAIYWVPDAIVRHATSVVPPAKRAEIGNGLLADIQRISGRPCTTSVGATALNKLYRRLLPDRSGRLVVVSSDAPATGHLPGGTIFINRTLIEDHDTPDVVAGYVLAEALRANSQDPLEALLAQAGPMAAARLLTTGDLPDRAISAHAESLMTARPAKLPDQPLLDEFRRARLASSPYAYAHDISGESTLALIEADPGAVEKVLSDADWISLQSICGS